MNFRFDNILEDWAALYKPISHDKEKGSKNKRFFRIKTINTENEFGRNANSTGSPVMLYSILVDAQTNGKDKIINYRHMIYFASKAISRSLAKTAKQDEDLGTDQQQAMDDMIQDLLAYLDEMKKSGKNPITEKLCEKADIQGLKGLQLDSAEWASAPVKFNEWHIMGLAIEGLTPRKLCVDEELYIKPEEPNIEPTNKVNQL